LIKIRFDRDRNERDVLAGKVAEATGAALIMQVGKVAVYYRQKAPASND
jgi:RNA-binding protein YhbY